MKDNIELPGAHSFEIKHEAEEAIEHGDFKFLPIQYEALSDECRSNEVLNRLFSDMIAYCMSYAESVIAFQKIAMRQEAGEEVDDNFKAMKVEVDAIRKRTHDVTIDSVNILARNLAEQGKNSSWIRKLSGNRAAYGRFAILMAFARILKDSSIN
jgi:hypothetical protein